MERARWKAFWIDPWRDLLAALAPGPCALCEGPLGRRAVAGVCPRCWAELARLAPPPGERRPSVCTPFRYEGPVVTLHRRLKFAGDLALVRPLARRMAAALRAARHTGADLVVAVPPDPLRLPPRRFAARRLARAVAREFGLPFDRAALRKRRPTGPQTRRTRRARLARMTGLFRARPGRVTGRRVLLVDDVVTTGATLDEARRALLAAGATAVLAVALARTPAPGRDRGAASAGWRGATGTEPIDRGEQVPDAERLGQHVAQALAPQGRDARIVR